MRNVRYKIKRLGSDVLLRHLPDAESVISGTGVFTARADMQGRYRYHSRMGKPQLLYFDIRGRAEPIRMLLAFLEVDFEDVQITLEQWSNARADTPFSRMPVYREDELEIPETFAILAYLGRRHDLCGETETDRIRCDVTIEAWRDYGNRVANAFGALSESEDARRHFVSEEQPALLADLQSFYLKKPAESDFWAGRSATICDFAAFHLIDGLTGQFPAMLAKFPALESFHRFFSGIPKVKQYLESPQRPRALFYGPNGKIYPRD